MIADKRWRKVTKKHPGKKWEGIQVIVAYIPRFGNERLCVGLANVPKVYVWPHEAWVHDDISKEQITHWMPWPKPPEIPIAE